MLSDRIEQDLVAALKSGDETKKLVLRALKSALKYLQTDQGVEKITNEEVLTILKREVKRRKESIESYTQANRPELAENERAELVILEAYLPAQMDPAKIEKKIDAYLASHPVTNQTIGQAMRDLSTELKGQADMGQVSQILRSKIEA